MIRSRIRIMKTLALSLGIALTGSLSACQSKDASPAAAASGSAAERVSAGASPEGSPKIAAGQPRVGGSVAVVGEHSVEFKLHRSGAIEALVTNAAGELVSDGATLSMTTALEGGGREEAKLAFAKPHGRFEGRCQGKIAPGRVDIGLDAKGKAQKGVFENAVVLRGPELGGSVLVAGSHSAEVFAKPSGEVYGFVSDRTGVAVEGDGNLDVTARVRTAAGATEDVSLVFEPPRGCFVGKAKAELAAGPIELGIAPKGAASLHLGRLEKMSLMAEASHGGEVLVAGDFSAELVLDAKTKSLLAFVADASGKASTDANLDVTVSFGADTGKNVSLKWDAKRLCYRGDLSAEAGLDARPIRVEIGAAGAAFVGAAASLRSVVDARLKAAAKLDADAAVGAAAKLDANAKGKANVKANVAAPAVSAKVAIVAPKVNVDEKASAGAKAGAKAGGGAKANAKAKGSIKVGF
jgi:hypothetical protein